MARTGITYRQVAEAAKAMQARGEELTLKAVRDELGGEGSFTTISKFLKQYAEEQAGKEDDPELPPQEVQNALMTVAIEAWQAATKEHRKEVAALKHAHDKELKAAQADRDEVLKANEKLEGELKEALAAYGECQARENLKMDELLRITSELETTKRLYAELVASIGTKQPSASGKKAADTKPERPSTTKAAPASTQS